MRNLEAILERVQDTEIFKDAVACLSKEFFADEFEGSDIFDEDELSYFCMDYSTDSIDFTFCSGVTKVVLVCTAANGDNYVLKTSFAGYASYDVNDEDEDADNNDEDEAEKNGEKLVFEHYPHTNESRVEYLVYQAACEEGLDEFFAETIEISPTIYMQEKYDKTVDASCRSVCEKYVKPELYQRYKESNDTVFNWWKYEEVEDFARRVGLGDFFHRLRSNCTSFLLFYSLYSLEKLFFLQNFLQVYDINDLHGGNIGFFGDKIKFIDFCGYESITAEKVGAA